jgi:hypothetical protein
MAPAGNCADRASVRGLMKRFGSFGVALVAAVWVTCSGGVAVAGKSASSDPALSAAVKAWASFPVNEHPRELVLTGDDVVPGGFPSNDTKEAFLSGLFVSPPTLPTGPSNAGGFPLVTSQAALETMRSEGTPGPGHPAPLVISGVSLGTGSFNTDRGTQVLPAWMFTFDGVTNPAAVLAVAASSRFPLPATSSVAPGVGASTATGRTLDISFVGAAAGAGPCTADYALDARESKTAVAVSIRQTRYGDGTEVVCAAVGYQRHVRLRLTAPLRNRVLVDAATKGPVAVVS